MQILTPDALALRQETALCAARAAGDILLRYYEQSFSVNTKSSESDLVTQADLEADAAIRQIIGQACPEDTLITEETFVEGQNIDLTSAWIVDPLDGTTNFAHGFPYFAVSIAYVQNGKTQIGVILDPLRNELFIATPAGAFRNDAPIRVSSQDKLSRSLLATGFPYDIVTNPDENTNLDLHARFLKQTHGIRRAGAAALDLASVACGRLDGFWEQRLSPWDIAAGAFLIEQAGGKVSDFVGEPLNLAQRRIDILGAGTEVHDRMLKLILSA